MARGLHLPTTSMANRDASRVVRIHSPARENCHAKSSTEACSSCCCLRRCRESHCAHPKTWTSPCQDQYKSMVTVLLATVSGLGFAAMGASHVRLQSSVNTPRQQRVEARCWLVADDVLPKVTRQEAKSQANRRSVFTPDTRVSTPGLQDDGNVREIGGRGSTRKGGGCAEEAAERLDPEPSRGSARST